MEQLPLPEIPALSGAERLGLLVDRASPARDNRTTCQWGRDQHNVLLTGPTGIGNTWRACALGHKACRDGWTALSRRLPRVLQDLPRAKGDGRSVKRMTLRAQTAVLSLDAWGLAPRSEENRRDLLALLDDRYDRRATVVTSQRPVAQWHEALGAPTLAAARLDRLVPTADKIPLQGASMRKRQTKLPQGADSDEP